MKQIMAVIAIVIVIEGKVIGNSILLSYYRH